MQIDPDNVRAGMRTALEITDLSTDIELSRATVHPVGNVSLKIERGETLGLVGESGSGKSMLGLSVLGLLPNGARVSVDAFVSEKALSRVLRAMKAMA